MSFFCLLCLPRPYFASCEVGWNLRQPLAVLHVLAIRYDGCVVEPEPSKDYRLTLVTYGDPEKFVQETTKNGGAKTRPILGKERVP